MVNIENIIYSDLADALKAEFPEISMNSEYAATPPKFPHCSFYEISNVPAPEYQTTESVENYSVIDFGLEVYSNKTSGKKAEAKAIATFANNYLQENYKLIRTVFQPIDNMANSTIYRYTGRYRTYLDVRTGILHTG